MNIKPDMSLRQICNMSVGFFGLQFAFGLQAGDMSRIFQTLGAQMQQLPFLWVAAPLTGLIVQPLIGYASDHTWGRFGRRRPYFLIGAVLSTAALLVMPQSSTLLAAAVMLWMMDVSFNVSMEPFRAFVADQLSIKQRPLGFSLQSLFIGVGGAIASALPWLLTKFGVSNVASAGNIPATVHFSFYIGGAALLCAVLWTVFTSREYPPDQLRSFKDSLPIQNVDVSRAWVLGVFLLTIGMGGVSVIWIYSLSDQLYLLAGGLTIAGTLLLWLSQTRSRNVVREVMADLYGMPVAMRRLAWVQFFSWFAMFAMWIYTVPAVAATQFGSLNPLSAGYNEGANWAGVLLGAYYGFAVLAAMLIAPMVRAIGLRWCHFFNLAVAAIGLFSFLWIQNPHWLLLSMVGIGFGWASILSIPYTLLSDSLPAEKMGVYMGIFNFFIVIPQILAASSLGVILKLFFRNQPVFGLVLGGVSLLMAALCTLRVAEAQGEPRKGGELVRTIPEI